MSLYVLQVASGEEKKVCSRLGRAGIRTLLPLTGRFGAAAPLFPDYLFFETEDAADPADIEQTVRQTPGVVKWLGFPSFATAALPPDEEARIRSLCAGERKHAYG